jgi:hypothetical protein
MVQETPKCQIGDYVRIVRIPVLQDIVGCIAAIDEKGSIITYTVAFSPFPERYFVQSMKMKLVQETGGAQQSAVSPLPLALLHFFSSRNISRIKETTEVGVLGAPFTERFVGVSTKSEIGAKAMARHATSGGGKG